MPVGMLSSDTLVLQKLSLLVVASSKELLKLVKAILASDNNRILLADNANNGLALAQTERPDVILAMSGIEEIGPSLCQQVRQDPLIAETPFVVLTSSSNRKTYVDYFAVGCDQILPIPFKCSDIYTAINNARKRNHNQGQRKIHALFKSGLADFIEPPALKQLLAAGEILCFYRNSDLVMVGRDPIRRSVRADFSGPERRLSMA